MIGILEWGQALPAVPLYAFVFAWLFVESTGFPISDEPLLLLSGYLTSAGRLNIVAVLGVALVGKVSASCAAFWLGQRMSPARPASGVGRLLYPVRPTQQAVLAVERRFRRGGAWAVFLGRLVPVVRSFISYPAGAAGMPFGLFLAATTAGSLLWIGTWTLLGAALGVSYAAALARWGQLSWLVLAAFLLALGAVWLWGHRRSAHAARGRDTKRTPTAER
jgi:membrane protein DedA with SNARE-associated domain